MTLSATQRTALLGTLFAVEGGATAVVAFLGLPPEEVFLSAVGHGWIIGLTCWWAVWPCIREGSPWRAWLEGLVIIGATYGCCVLAHRWIVWPTLPPQDANPGFGDALHYYLMSIVIVQLGLLMIVFMALFFVTRWRLCVPDDAEQDIRQFSLREMLLLIAVLALHATYLRGLLLEATSWDWRDIRNWMLTAAAGRLALIAVPTAMVFFAIVRPCLFARTSHVLSLVLLLGGLGGIWTYNELLPTMEPPLMSSLGLGTGIVFNGAVTACLLRMMGYRLTAGAKADGEPKRRGWL